MTFSRMRLFLQIKSSNQTLSSSNGEDTSTLPGSICWKKKEKSGSSSRRISSSSMTSSPESTTSLKAPKPYLSSGCRCRECPLGTRPFHRFWVKKTQSLSPTVVNQTRSNTTFKCLLILFSKKTELETLSNLFRSYKTNASNQNCKNHRESTSTYASTSPLKTMCSSSIKPKKK